MNSIIEAQLTYEEESIKRLGTFVLEDPYFCSHRFIFIDVVYLDDGSIFIPPELRGQLITTNPQQ